MDSYLICLVFSGLVFFLVCFVALGDQRNFQVPSLVKCHCLSDCSFIFCWILCEPFILFIQLFFTKLVLFYFISFAVILSNYYDLPFNDILDWRKFSVILKESDVYQLKQILKDIPNEKFLALHKNLIKVRASPLQLKLIRFVIEISIFPIAICPFLLTSMRSWLKKL